MIQKLIFSTLLTAGALTSAHAAAVKPEARFLAYNDPVEEELMRPITPSYLHGAVIPSWLDNWFLNVSGGTSAFIGSPIGCEDLFGRLEPALQISLGKWYTPAIGNRITFQGFKWKSGELQTQQYRHLHADLLWNIMPTFTHNGTDSRVDVIPLVGIGVIDNRSADTNPFAINYGIMGRYRLNDVLHLTAEIGHTISFKDADGYGPSRRFGDNLLSLTAGVSWTFGRNTGWKKVVDAGPYMRRNERLSAYAWSLKQRNEELERGYNDHARIIAELRKILDIEGLLDKYLHCLEGTSHAEKGYPVNDYSGLNSLRKRLREGHNSSLSSSGKRDKSKEHSKQKGHATDSVSLANRPADLEGYLSEIASEGDCIGAPIFFFFELGTRNLVDASQVVNLNEIARISRKYGLLIEVTGAADSLTGTEEINSNLGVARANYIAEYLTGQGVNKSQILTQSEGGIDTYKPNPANRNAVVRLFLP